MEASSMNESLIAIFPTLGYIHIRSVAEGGGGGETQIRRVNDAEVERGWGRWSSRSVDGSAGLNCFVPTWLPSSRQAVVHHVIRHEEIRLKLIIFFFVRF
jgi:hypothetical protein